MAETGFHQPRRMRPTGMALVVAAHASILTALALVKTPAYFEPIRRIIAYPVPAPADPVQLPPDPAPREDPAPVPQHRSELDATRVPIPPRDPAGGVSLPPPPLPPIGQSGGSTTLPADPPRDPVRIAAQVDPRFAGDLQPPYPPSEQRMEREGRVTIRLFLDAAGRVVSVERVSATSDAFWRVTERQALSRWRFRPETLDGRPVPGQKVMVVHFRLDG